MTKESTDLKTAAAPSSSAADSYIGSFISLTSKYEIRYEGVLYYLNPQDSTLGLNNVKSYGTEGRKKDGPQILPNDKIYEYILFRGSDIKDLQVKSSPPAHIGEPMHNDPAIIQSQFATGPNMRSYPSTILSQPTGHQVIAQDTSQIPATSFSSYAMPVPLQGYGEATVGNVYAQQHQNPSVTSSSEPMQVAAQKMRSDSSIMLSQPSGPQIPTTSVSSYAIPMPLQGYGGATRGNVYAQQHNNPSATSSFSALQNFVVPPSMQASTTIASTNSPTSVPSVPSLAVANLALPSTVASLTPERLPMQPMNVSSFSANSALSFPPGVLSANALYMSSLPSLTQNVDNNEVKNTANVVSDPVKISTLFGSSGASSIVDSSLGPSLKQSSILLSPDQLSQPRIAKSPAQGIFPVHKDMSAPFSVSSTTTTATQAPLLRAQSPGQEFTEEFDFEAMNEKFKKDEVWGHLGKAKHRDNMEILHDATVCQTSGDQEADGLAFEADSKPAYNKDDFFDSISCNTTSHRGRNVQNWFSDRMKQDTETFGQFQQRNYQSYGGYGAGRGMNRNPYGWGRGYNPGGRGRGGGYMWQ